MVCGGVVVAALISIRSITSRAVSCLPYDLKFVVVVETVILWWSISDQNLYINYYLFTMLLLQFNFVTD